MSAELIFPEQSAYNRRERDSWYFAHVVTAQAKSTVRVKRTAHAAAVGRALLAYYQGQSADTSQGVVKVFRYDNDPEPVATITDPRPVTPEMAELEKAVEAATAAQWKYNLLRRQVLDRIGGAWNAAQEHEPFHPHYLTGNQLAAKVDGLIPRQEVFARICLFEGEEDL